MRSIVLPVHQRVDGQMFLYLPNKSSWLAHRGEPFLRFAPAVPGIWWRTVEAAGEAKLGAALGRHAVPPTYSCPHQARLVVLTGCVPRRPASVTQRVRRALKKSL